VRAIVVAGRAGTGKSTLSEALVRRTGGVLLDLDILTNALLDRVFAATGLPGHWNEDRHREVVRPARYAALREVATDQVRLGRDVVLTAPFSAELQGGAEWDALRRALASDPLVVWLHAPADVLSARVLARGEVRDRAATTTQATGPSIAATEAPVVPHLALDATMPTDAQVAAVLAALSPAGRSTTDPPRRD
jgi:sugar-phosphatase